MSGSFPYNINYLFLYQFSLGKNGFAFKSKKGEDKKLQTNYFPQSSRGISLVDPIQRLFHPNPLPCLFYLMDSSSVIIQIHALPLRRRQSCNYGLFQE